MGPLRGPKREGPTKAHKSQQATCCHAAFPVTKPSLVSYKKKKKTPSPVSRFVGFLGPEASIDRLSAAQPSMVGAALARRVLLLPSLSTASWAWERLFGSVCHSLQSHSYDQSRASDGGARNGVKGKWFILPPFDGSADGASLGRELVSQSSAATSTATTAIKWVTRCCPDLPRSLVQKLFRLRQVCVPKTVIRDALS